MESLRFACWCFRMYSRLLRVLPSRKLAVRAGLHLYKCERCQQRMLQGAEVKEAEPGCSRPNMGRLYLLSHSRLGQVPPTVRFAVFLHISDCGGCRAHSLGLPSSAGDQSERALIG